MESLEQIDVTELLPQKRPFVMIDKIMYFDDSSIITCLLVTPENLFVENGLFTEPGICENFAQTGAARMGYINKYIEKDTIKIGFIGEIKNLIIERCPRVNEEVITSMEIVKEIFGTLMVKALSKVDDKIVASCEMKISMTDTLGHS